MKITKWNDDCIYFSDGSIITYDHIQDCCEYNYADFSVLEINYQQEEFVNFDIVPVEDCGFILSLQLEREPISPPNSQFYYNYTPNKKILIPCYSDQNGYYSTDLIIIVHHPDGTSNNYPLYCELRKF